MTRVLVADDHQLLRNAVRRALEESGATVISEAANGAEAVRLTETLKPDVVVMDVSMPVLDGIEATRRISAQGGDTRVVLLTMHDEATVRAGALDAGAVGFLTKDCTLQEVVNAVREVADGQVLIKAPVSRATLRMVENPTEPTPDDSPQHPPITRRENEILQAVADGNSTTEIAEQLFISTKTVKNHLASIYAKLESRDRTEAVLCAMRLGIVQLNRFTQAADAL